MKTEQFNRVRQLRHQLHAHPELSMEEHWTKARLMDFLRENTGLELVDRGAWFYARFRSGSDAPGIAFRTEMDALPIRDEIDASYASTIPGVGHKCGHDGHAAALCALALELEQTGAPRDVYLIFQPGEEIGAGGGLCAALLREAPIAEVYGWHNRPGLAMNTVQTIDGTFYFASKGMILHFEGVPSHASMPEVGRNPAFAIANLVNAIPPLTAPERWKGQTICTIIQMDVGERAFGTQASRGDLLLTIRGEYEAEMDALQEALEQLARQQAEQYGLTLSIAFCDAFPETANNPLCAARIRQAAKKLGLPVVEAPGPYRGSDDFGYYSKAVPGAMFELGGGEACPPIHTAGFDFPDQLIPTAVAMMNALVSGE